MMNDVKNNLRSYIKESWFISQNVLDLAVEHAFTFSDEAIAAFSADVPSGGLLRMLIACRYDFETRVHDISRLVGSHRSFLRPKTTNSAVFADIDYSSSSTPEFTKQVSKEWVDFQRERNGRTARNCLISALYFYALASNFNQNERLHFYNPNERATQTITRH